MGTRVVLWTERPAALIVDMSKIKAQVTYYPSTSTLVIERQALLTENSVRITFNNLTQAEAEIIITSMAHIEVE